MQWSDGSYMEDQDMWWLSGIFRDVSLISRPMVHVADVKRRRGSRCEISRCFAGGFGTLNNLGDANSKHSIEIALLDEQKQPRAQESDFQGDQFAGG